jgi:hypothetical protein
MTTVINFNILNFFKPALDQYGSRDARPDNQLSRDNRSSTPGRHRIIDVTQSSSAAYDEGELVADSRNARPAQIAAPTHLMTETYDRRGRSVQYISHKGLNVNSYV